jgi:hypothetical protein
VNVISEKVVVWVIAIIVLTILIAFLVMNMKTSGGGIVAKLLSALRGTAETQAAP